MNCWDCYLIVEVDKTFVWVYQNICDQVFLDNCYSFVDEKDVPENIKKKFKEQLEDPFFEIEAERYKVSLTV